MKFLYMDDHYLDPKTYRQGDVNTRYANISLTGVTIPAKTRFPLLPMVV